MALILQRVLDSETHARVSGLLAQAKWQDGRNTAGWHAKAVKGNEQASGTAADEARTLIADALMRHEVFQSVALPRQLSPVLINRYGPGMQYGAHVDDALMGRGAARMRSDLSLTLFLTSEENYSGGALVISSTSGEDEIRLPAGDAVLYPSTSLHRVATVESGERLAAIVWVQSLVREEAAREILFDLDRARRALFTREGKSELFDLISKSYANLLRRWSEL